MEFDDSPSGAVMVDNLDWWKGVNYLEILRDIGPHVSINRMLTFESVRLRLEKEEHMSFLEFNYMILQAYDFYHLYREYGCQLQLCGADQWGNVVAGVELTRRLQFTKHGNEYDQKMGVFGLSTPLLLDTNGKKLGKSEGNALWVNEELLSPFDYFQYFRNVNDLNVLRFLKIYTDMPVEKIDSMESEDINSLKKILAFEATKICHGEKVAKECLERAEQIFEIGNDDFIETLEYSSTEEKISLHVLLKEFGFAKSNGEARGLIEGGGVRIDGNKIFDKNYQIVVGTKKELKLAVGKKKIIKIVVVPSTI
jgi:tyrosyl-tRNA synthetase